MPAHEVMSREQFSGWLPIESLRPTERSVVVRERGPAGRQYRNEMKTHIAEHGFTMGPLEVDYGKQFSSSRKPQALLKQGHHRYWVAKQLGMTHVPVEGRTTAGPVPGLLKERP
jgi:hypothetical protein